MEAQKLLLPVSLSVSIALSALYLGREIGNAERRFKDLETKVSSVDSKLAQLGATSAAVAMLRSDVEALKKDTATQQRTFRQLWYYTHGRIQHMPWHPPQQPED